MLRITASSFVVLAVVASAASAQSLASVAKASNEQRKEQGTRSKVYTNDNLRQDITPSTPGASAATDPATPATAAPVETATAAASDTATHDEKYWKERMKAARESLERNESFASALQSQINGLTTQFVNRDDPAQRAGIEQQRSKAVGDLEKVQRDIEASKKAIAAVEDDARKAGVPAGWLR